jgi:enoyl-CoA hydratase/carnithine racemase
VIRWESTGAVGLATIDREERRNALNAELCEVLRGHLDAQDPQPTVVITGAGTAFCAGADLVTRFEPAAGEEEAPTDTFRPTFERLTQAIADYPAPVIAAVHGPALGAG